MAKRRSVDPSREDGLSIRKARARHDEAQPPRGYELQPDGWPVWKPPKGSRKPTPDDQALAHALIRAVRWAIGEMDDWKPGPDDVIMNDDARARLEAAYTAVTGHPWSHLMDLDHMRRHRIEQGLANLLRLREQARVYTRIRQHRGKPDAPRAAGIAMSGLQIVERLTAMAALHVDLERTRPLFDELAAARLAKLIDELPEGSVNLGGTGGRSGGRTPEAWARSLVLALRDPNAARADYEKRWRRSRRRPPDDDTP